MEGGEDLYFSVGYPLGYYKTSETELFSNEVEFKGKSVMLEQYLHIVWGVCRFNTRKSDDSVIEEIEKYLETTGCFTSKQDKEVQNMLKTLIERGVVIHVESNEELFDSVKDFRVIRHGFAECDHEAMVKANELILIPLMFVTSEPTPISDVQLDIWRKANGLKTLEQIFNESFSDMTVSIFIENILYLQDESLISLV